MKKLFTLLFIFISCISNAQKISNILLEKNTHSILKKSNTTLEILDSKKFITTTKYSLILKNKYAKSHKNIHIFYNNFRKIKEAKVVIRDLMGSEIEIYKLKDFEDKVYDLQTIDSDGRYKELELSYNNYPFEIEVSYEIHHSSSLFYDFWQPQFNRMHIIDAELKVIDYTKSNLRYLNKNIANPLKKTNDKATTYTWNLKNIPSETSESFNRQWDDYYATVILSPVNFEMEGYKGELSSWNKFGQWIHMLNETKNTLDENDISSIKKLNLKKETKIETIKSVYAFLQETTRYISIQIGIGGYQPLATKLVHEKKYGDCKALSYYTKSLLALLDIDSHYTLINAGANIKDLEEDFPSPYFNHAILTVPIDNDTIYLECTSQTNPFGYSGTFTGNRKALLIKNNKSTIINTQGYSTKDNRIKSTTHLVLNNENESSNGRLEREYHGTEIEHQNFLNQYNATEKKRFNWIQDKFNYGASLDIDSFKLNPLVGDIFPKGGFLLVFTNKKEVNKRGNRLFITPHNHFTKSPIIPTENTRRTPIRIRFGYKIEDNISYKIGSNNFMIESNKKDLKITSEYGYYSLSIDKIDDLLVISRKFQLNDGVYSSKEFESFKKFLVEVKKNDQSSVVLKHIDI